MRTFNKRNFSKPSRRIQRAYRAHRKRSAMTKLKKDVKILKKQTQYKHLHTYENFSSINSAMTNQPQFVFTNLFGEDATGIPANWPNGALRNDNKILVQSITSKLQFYPSTTARANYYDIRVMLVLVPDTRNLNQVQNFELQNFLNVLDPAVGYCYTRAPKRSILNDPALGLTDAITSYRVLSDKIVRLHTVLATTNNSAANNNTPQSYTLHHRFPNGLDVSYATDQEDTCYRNNLILHIVPSNVGALPAAPSCDMLSTIRWSET